MDAQLIVALFRRPKQLVRAMLRDSFCCAKPNKQEGRVEVEASSCRLRKYSVCGWWATIRSDQCSAVQCSERTCADVRLVGQELALPCSLIDNFLSPKTRHNTAHTSSVP